MYYDTSEIHTRAQWEARAAQLSAAFTTTQLERLERRAWDTLVKRSGCSGWDIPTLGMVYPGFLNALRAIATARNMHARAAH